jgi:hypothetical protein
MVYAIILSFTGIEMQKGLSLELRAFEALKHELENNRLGFLPEACRIFHQKGYFSRDRGKDIQIDVSIEVFLPNAPTWSWLLACECKDYSGSIPVDDVEEFWSKLTQIAGANVKGCMVITGGMQESALNFARAKGIAVIRLLPENQIYYVAHFDAWSRHSEPGESVKTELDEHVSALTVPHFMAEEREFFGLHRSTPLRDWASSLDQMLEEFADIESVRGLFCYRVTEVFRAPSELRTWGNILLGQIVRGAPVTIVTGLSEQHAVVLDIGVLTYGNKARAGDYAQLTFDYSVEDALTPGCIITNQKTLSSIKLDDIGNTGG